jgi:NDP-sugar pyrophosphorylase family protein
MQQPTLLILAAGIGSRYGSLKQIDRFGPAGETIVEYSIFDALRAGFGKIVIVVRQHFVDDFREIVLKRAMNRADISFVYQELDHLPPGYTVPPDRLKPWGTGHAVLMAAGVIDTSFAVINADDFYGAESYVVIGNFLSRPSSGNVEEYCLVDYRLGNTLSESGTVSRGVCQVDENGYLTNITEHKKIIRNGKDIISRISDTESVVFTGDEPVSMNLMGFRPSMFNYLQHLFREFLDQHIGENNAEFYIPFAMNEVIRSGKAVVKVLSTRSRWFGITYREDREIVSRNLKSLVQQGAYPKDLWT